MAEHDKHAERVLQGQSWSEFCDALKAAGEVIDDPLIPLDPLHRAEGYRYLSRLLRAGLQTFIENGDASAPTLERNCHETIKMGADNPDNLYLSAPVSARHTYRLRGTRGTVHYLGFGLQEGSYGATGSLQTVAYLDDQNLVVEPDGSIVVHIGVEAQPGNWLAMTPETRTLVVRQSFLRRDTEEPAELVLERTDGPAEPAPLSARRLDRGLQGTSRFVHGCARLFLEWARGFSKHPNELPPFHAGVATQAGGVPDITYYHGYWKLAPDEALVIDATPPDCDYWNFQLNNIWMESLDYRYFPVTLNNATATPEKDGSYRLIVAHSDPGHPNWIRTCGHDLGTMCWRWVRADEHPQPQTRVVKLESLR